LGECCRRMCPCCRHLVSTLSFSLCDVDSTRRPGPNGEGEEEARWVGRDGEREGGKQRREIKEIDNRRDRGRE